MDYALNNPQKLICHKTKPNQINSDYFKKNIVKNILENTHSFRIHNTLIEPVCNDQEQSS